MSNTNTNTNTNTTNLTIRQIRGLRAEALEAGDYEQVDVCNHALDTSEGCDRTWTVEEARSLCAAALNETQSSRSYFGEVGEVIGEVGEVGEVFEIPGEIVAGGPETMARALCRELAVVMAHQVGTYPELDTVERCLAVFRDPRATIAQLVIAAGYLRRAHGYEYESESEESRAARQNSAIYRVRVALEELANAEAGWSSRCDARLADWAHWSCTDALRALYAVRALTGRRLPSVDAAAAARD